MPDDALVSFHDPAKRALYRRDADLARGLDVVRRAAGAHAAGVVRSSALALFTPGTLAAGRLADGIALLERSGFTPVHGRALQLDDRDVATMWRHRLPLYGPERRELIFAILLVGPSFLVLARGDPGGHADAALRLAALKGPSNPALGGPDDLRTRLGAANKIVNLLHTADEACDVVRESAILLPERELEGAWAALARAAPADAVARRTWLSSVPPARPAGVSLAHTCVLLRARLAAALAAARAADRDAAVDAVVERAGAELDWARSVAPSAPRDALAAYRARRPSPAPDEFRRAAAPAGAYGLDLAAAFDETDAVLTTGRCDVAALRAACARTRVHLDAWDEVVVATETVSTGG